MKKVFSMMIVFLFAGITTAFAHFQVVYTPNTILTPEDSNKISMTMVFTHPFEAGHTMSMGMDSKEKVHKPKSFVMINKGKSTNLIKKLKPITFTSLTNSGTGYVIKKLRLKGMGDFVFALDPGPYYEGAEDIYIQQYTKMIINRGGASTDWTEPAGMPTEILPLDKPYALWTGNLFRGVVVMKKGGKYVPVPGAEIEVEFMNHPIKGNAFQKAALVEAPQDAYVTQGIIADQNGQFSYSIPKAGWWGFCALGSGGEATHEGKELSKDAVIWVQAVDMK